MTATPTSPGVPTTITNLPAAGIITGSELVAIVQNGITVHTTATSFSTGVGGFLPSGDIFVGNASNIATAVSVSGDATLANTGALTVNKVNGLSLGTAAYANIGTSGGTIPLLNGNNNFSGTNDFSSGSAIVSTQASSDNSTKAASTAFVKSLISLPQGFANKFRNASMNIAQRGTSGTVTAGTTAYTLDGWQMTALGANQGWSLDTSYIGFGTQNSFEMLGASGVTTTAIAQRIESYLCSQFDESGAFGFQSITVSLSILNLTGSSITPTFTVSYANSQDNWASSTNIVTSANLQTVANSTQAILQYTFAAVSGVANGLQVQWNFGSSMNGSGKNIFVTAADIRVNPGATVGAPVSPVFIFEPRDISSDLTLCRRYFVAFGASSSSASGIASGVQNSSTTANIVVPLPNAMRIAPTGITISSTSHFNIYTGSGGTSAITGLTYVGSSVDRCTVQATGASGLTGGFSTYLQSISASAQLLFTGAEL